MITSKGKERDTDTLPLGRKDFNDVSLIHQNSSDDETSTELSSHDGRKGSSSNSLGSFSEDEVETKRPISSYLLIPPPYLKQKTNTGESNSKRTTHSEAAGKGKRYPSQQQEHDTGENRRLRTSHVRWKSLPSEPTTEVETSNSKGHARTISLESGIRGGGSWRVHPNLPDYDDLRARLLALRQR